MEHHVTMTKSSIVTKFAMSRPKTSKTDQVETADVELPPLDHQIELKQLGNLCVENAYNALFSSSTPNPQLFKKLLVILMI